MKIKYTEPLWGEMNYRFSRNVNKERATKLTDKKVNVGKNSSFADKYRRTA